MSEKEVSIKHNRK